MNPWISRALAARRWARGATSQDRRKTERPEERRRLRLEGVRILLVEDNEDLRNILVEELRSSGAKVTSAASGRSGFTAYLLERPDLVVSDLCMQDGSGYDLIEQVRQLAAGSDGGLVPAIAMSSAAEGCGAIAAGFRAFLQKPFDCAELIDVIEGFLPRGRRTPSAASRDSASGRGSLLRDG